MATENELLEILDKDTVDTSRWTTGNEKEDRYFMESAESRLYGLAVPQENGTLRAWHVTDDPEKVVELLKKKGEFYARQGDLCGGLYVSGVPHFWEGRSQKKWDFLPKLPRKAREKLYSAIQEKLADQFHTHYITPSEYENAERVISQAMVDDVWQVLDIVANQPFNINIPQMAKDLGIADAFKPPYVPVDFVGRYLEFNTQRAIDANEELLRIRHGSLEGLTRTDLCNMLKQYGWDGVYTKAGMGTNPELVIWSGDKIMTFGEWSQESATELSGPESPTVLYDPFHEHPFEANLSIARRVADLVDTKRKLIIPTFNKGNVAALKETIQLILEGQPMGEVPHQVRKFLRGLGEEDLGHLLELVNGLLESMQ